jgi:tripartite-type tricarboxylate transporter receptor subunit TctC
MVRAGIGAGMLAVGAAHLPLQAQELVPSMKIVLGFPPGGATDVSARWLAERLTGTFAKTAIVDNRPGAAGRLAVDLTKSAPADGSTMLITPSSVVALYPNIYTKLSYDPFADLTPVSHVCEFVHGLAVGPSVPASIRSLKDFVAWCKVNPAAASCATPGEGSSPHLLVSMLSKETGVAIQPVAYKGTGPAINDVVGGQVAAIMVVAEGAYLSYQKEGKLRVLATSGPERSKFFPGVPTFNEEGVKSIVFKEWFGLFMPTRTPREVVARANAAVRSALTQPDIIEKFAGFAMVASPSTPQELENKLRHDHDFWARTVKATGFNPMSS